MVAKQPRAQADRPENGGPHHEHRNHRRAGRRSAEDHPLLRGQGAHPEGGPAAERVPGLLRAAHARARVYQAGARSGLLVGEVRALLDLWRDKRRTSTAVKLLAARHLDALDRRLVELQSVRGSLAHLVEHCRGDERPDFPILDDLGQDW